MDDDRLGQPSTSSTGHDTVDAHGNPGDEGRESGGNRGGGHSGNDRTLQPQPSTKEYSCTFNMGFKHRGKAVIFNNKNFQPSTGKSIRNGTDVDASNLKTLFENMGFLVSKHKDLTADKMVSTMKQEAQDEDYHRNADCFACIILSHGDDKADGDDNDDIIYGTDKELSLKKLVEPFKGLPSLAGKPKLFFIQACRDHLVKASYKMFKEPNGRIPIEADFFMAYSFVPGYCSWSNSEKGSWFVEALVKVFSLNNNLQRMDLLTLMTRVTKEVAYEFASNYPHAQAKQVPSITSMLTKDVYFTPKHTEPCPIPAVPSLQSPSESSSPAGASTTTASLDPPQLSPVGSAGNGKPRHTIDTTADCYAMAARYRGLAVVVNNDKFDPVDKKLNQSDRHGTVKDGQDLAKLLIDMGFDDVNVMSDLTAEDMKRDLRRVAKDERHNDADCFVCVILTHGDKGGVLYGTDGVPLTVEDVIAPFAYQESLRDKPKLFLFQACRGNMFDGGVAVDAPGDDVDAPGNDVDDKTLQFPTGPDLLLAFSCVNGYYSMRHTIEGSVFASAVVKVFGDNWQRMDVGTMMTRVAQKMAYEFQSNTPHRLKSHKKKQVPCMVSTLTKDLYFTPKS